MTFVPSIPRGFSGYSGYSGGAGSAGSSGFSGYSGAGISGFSGFSGTSATSTKTINQTSHGFTVGDIVRLNGSTYVLAQADDPSNADVVGIVTAVIDPNTFVITTHGWVSGLSGLVAGTVYFLSTSSAGDFQNTEPTVVGEVSKPLLIADATTSGYFFNWRGTELVDDDGVSGFSGYSGPSGSAGTSGFSGYSGPAGSSGFSGYSGHSGFSGYSGRSGFSGYSGISLNYIGAWADDVDYNRYDLVAESDNDSIPKSNVYMCILSHHSTGSDQPAGNPVTGGAATYWTTFISATSGFSGYSGRSGFSGYSGISGFSGYSGPGGAAGTSGFSGYSGISGFSGYSGPSGFSGYSGISGFSGYSGPSGFSGYSGPSGFSGYSGPSGFSGYSGPSGFSGYSGISAFSGYSGGSGFSGYSGPVLSTGRITATWYAAGTFGQPFGSNGTITLDRLYAMPFYVGNSQSFDRIGVNALGTASSFMRLGIYADNNGKPGNLISDYGQVSTSGSGAADINISVTLQGLVWVAAVGQGVAPSTSRLGAAVVSPWTPTSDHYSVNFCGLAISQNSISGALPSPWGSTYNIEVTANTVPMAWLRAT